MAPITNVLIYVVRHDLRVADNPIFDRLASTKDHGFTKLLPVYVFHSQQFEVSGFIQDGSASPYPEARSNVSQVWRTGPHRAKFVSQCVWELKNNLEAVGSGLLIRAGNPVDVVSGLIEALAEKHTKVGGVWMTEEEGVEEQRDQKALSKVCEKAGAVLTLFNDEKYFIDDRDVPMRTEDVPDVFTNYRKSMEPLRAKPRATLPKPEKGTLPSFPEASQIPPQHAPFVIPTTYDELEDCVLSPVRDFSPKTPACPKGAESAHPFSGGESSAHERLRYLIKEGLMYSYKETRNGLLGKEFSTKLSAFLSQGCITARQIHHELVSYEDGTNTEYEHAKGYNEGENEGTGGVRFELLWRDYMRLCSKKFGHRLFSQDGFQNQSYEATADQPARKTPKWKTSIKDDALPEQKPSPTEIAEIIERFNAGTTGMGLIDASQRELLHTGYTSNRARQNVASFLTKHLGIDWRIGAEWYEMLLVDYDVSSNWANWQYVAGVGNDPRGEARIFNPVKQAFEYDKPGTYVKAWVPEVQSLEKLENVFQVCTTAPADLEKAGLSDNIMVTDPVKRIEFLVDGKPKANKRPFNPRGGRGGRRGGGSHTQGDGGMTQGPNGGAASWGGRGVYRPPPRGMYNEHGRGGPPPPPPHPPAMFQPGYGNYFQPPPAQQHGPPLHMGGPGFPRGGHAYMMHAAERAAFFSGMPMYMPPPPLPHHPGNGHPPPVYGNAQPPPPPPQS